MVMLPMSINFEIPDPLVGGVHTIYVGNAADGSNGALPTLADAVILDGTTDSDYAGIPMIQLDGTDATGASAGLWLRTSDSTITGFIIHSFEDEGIEIDGTLGPANNNVVKNNWIGIDATGAVSANAGEGILITDGASGNVIGGTGPNDGNVISGNTGAGVLIRDNLIPGTTNNTLQGNLIGTDSTGTLDRGNTGAGVRIESGADSNTIGTAGAGNVISGNTGVGIVVDGADNITIAGNYIGTDVTGMLDRGNDLAGILLTNGASNNTIGA